MISVVVAVYNVEKYLEKCLRSILEQSFQDFELILVDDGSKDKSINVAETVLKDSGKDYRVIKKENGGQSSARNAGLKAAKGEYVVFIDSDDVISKDFLSSLYGVFEDDMDFSFCGFKYVKTQDAPEDNDEGRMKLSKDELIDVFLKRSIDFVVPSMLIKRDFLLNNDLFFREEIRYSEDQLFIWEVIFSAEKAVYLNKRMYGYYHRPQSIMTGSPYQKIVNGFHVYSDFCKELEERYPQYTDKISMILPRWELGTLYSAASLMDYEEYRDLYKMMEAEKILKKIKGISEIKAYLLALVSRISPRLLYELCRRMDLNG